MSIKNIFHSLFLTIIIILILIETLESQVPDNSKSFHQRFEYKYSFKGPYLAQKDGTVPFWEYTGDAIASEELVRVTPSLHSKKGQIWSKLKTNFEWWQVDLVFRVNGKGRIGADGLAFWYTDRKYPPGPVFGSADNWNGLAIFFDSFDNDGKGNNPYIMAMYNDGTKSYDHNSDGLNQQLQGCLRDFRNKPFPVRAKIQYYKNVLTLAFHSGNTNNEEDYELCFRVENLILPQFGHFGVTAATGGLADDHDVLKFLTYSLNAPSQTQGSIPEADKERFNKEYAAYKAKLEQQREEYLKAHPDVAKQMEMESENAAESEFDYSVKELRQIYSVQSQLYEHIRGMGSKLDEILGRQEHALSLINQIQSRTPIATGGQQAPQISGVPISRQEVESILAVEREVLQSSREIKTLLQHGSPQGQHSSQVVGSQDACNQQLALLQQLLNEVRENMNVVRREFGQLTTRIAGSPVPSPQIAPVATGCISTLTFLSMLGVHLILILGALYYFIASKDNQSKKFY